MSFEVMENLMASTAALNASLG